ncbi:beta-lactamase superfamily domain protein [Francisella frigiditurris]|uniref:Beta-lactamase superfamily domain protein n=2 Tax=Francisella frigiditurris TaxID=1542390 RepID=A0A1J0KRZ9_9GAMM|nr:beta-lactamase superfamily domain protein [Francisella frigiditurris]
MNNKLPYYLSRGRFSNSPGGPRRTMGGLGFIKFLISLFLLNRKPSIPENHILPTQAVLDQLKEFSTPSVTWLGHAAFLIHMADKIILTDPFLSENAGPWFLGPKRFVRPALDLSQLPKIDIMVVSHNHYDHLDSKVLDEYPYKAYTQVVVPLGLKLFFIRKGFLNIVELSWWQQFKIKNISIKALPAVHFSGRGLFDRNKTLWASFSFSDGNKKVWFSGDTAKGDIFNEIGISEGPFDLALVGIGAYEPRSFMQSVHASPEDAIEIVKAINAKKAVGMHWGSIMLTTEPPFEPPVRFKKAAIDQNYGEDNALILKIGETISI